MKQGKRKRVTVAAPAEAAAASAQAAAAPSTAKQSAAKGGVEKSAEKFGAYRFSASCTVRDCGALKMALSDLLNTDGDAVLDVSAIERIDTAALQLMYAFVRERNAHGRKVLWTGKSDSFYEAVALLGLASHLDIAHAGDAA